MGDLRGVNTAGRFAAFVSSSAAIGVLLGAVACSGGAAADKEESAGPRQLEIFVFDRSTSIEDYQLELARRLANEEMGRLRHGDRIAAFQVLQLSLAEPPRRWSQQVPKREYAGKQISSDSIALARFVQDARDYLRPFSEPSDRQNINGTDLLSTLHDVGEEVRAHPGHAATVYMFSDMLQSNRMIDMEGLRRMPEDGWVAAAKESGMLPDLRGVCIVVVGGRVDTEAAQRVKRFWIAYFEATGATLLDENYTHRPVSLPAQPCPGVQE